MTLTQNTITTLKSSYLSVAVDWRRHSSCGRVVHLLVRLHVVTIAITGTDPTQDRVLRSHSATLDSSKPSGRLHHQPLLTCLIAPPPPLSGTAT
jgi:hypothetical protein